MIKKHYLLDSSEKEESLIFFINTVNGSIDELKKYNNSTSGGIVDMNEELELLYGIIFVSMQNYITTTIAECYKTTEKRQSKEGKESFKKMSIKGVDLGLPKPFIDDCTIPQIICALANYFKHRDELITKTEDMLNELSSESDKDDSLVDRIGKRKEQLTQRLYETYHSATADVLKKTQAFNPNDMLEFYPLLDFLRRINDQHSIESNNSLEFIMDGLFDWSKALKEQTKVFISSGSDRVK